MVGEDERHQAVADLCLSVRSQTSLHRAGQRETRLMDAGPAPPPGPSTAMEYYPQPPAASGVQQEESSGPMEGGSFDSSRPQGGSEEYAQDGASGGVPMVAACRACRSAKVRREGWAERGCLGCRAEIPGIGKGGRASPHCGLKLRGLEAGGKDGGIYWSGVEEWRRLMGWCGGLVVAGQV